MKVANSCLQAREEVTPSKGEVRGENREALKERNVAIVLIDGLGSSITMEEKVDHSYIRFHGRNYDIQYSEEEEDDYRLNRYDYLYTQELLTPWKPRIEGSEVTTGKVKVYSNNHAKAIRNDFQLMYVLAIAHKAQEINLQDKPATLGASS